MEKIEKNPKPEELAESVPGIIDGAKENVIVKESGKHPLWRRIFAGFAVLLTIAMILFFYFANSKKTEKFGVGDEIGKSLEEESFLLAKEHCENSGGRWDSEICNTFGCQPEYFCNCLIRKEDKDENELSKQEAWFRLNIEEVCGDCLYESDCGANECEMVGNVCRQESASCEDGVCHTKRYFSLLDDAVSYTCQNNQCVAGGAQTSLYSDWSLYVNEVYGFSFRYPKEYACQGLMSSCVDGQIGDPLNIKIEKYTEAPEILDENMHTLTTTKKELEAMKEKINMSPTSFSNGIKYSLVEADYDVQSGVFFNEISFFLGQDYIRIYINLYSGGFTWGEDKDLIDEAKTKIINKELDAGILAKIENFEKIVSTLEFSQD